MLFGLEIFDAYKDAKAKFKDFDKWSAETVRDEFGTLNQGPLMAAKIAKTTKLPWTNATVFESIALVLNGREAIPNVDQDISIKELAFAAMCLKTEFPDDEFEEPVLKYIAAQAGEEGMVVLPSELEKAQKYIPNIFLNKEQQTIQNAYLSECKDYVDIMVSSMVNKEDNK